MRNPLTSVLAVFISVSLSLTALAPVAAFDAPDETTMEGTLTELIAETPGHENSEQHINAIELDSGELVELELTSSEAAALPPSGSEIEVEGVLAADEASLEVTEVTTTEAAPIMAAPTNRRIAVLLTNFTDDSSTPWTPAAVEATFFAAAPARSVASFYASQSYGSMAISGDVFGYYTVAPERATSCAYSAWGTSARAAAAAAGVNLDSYDHVVIAFPRQTQCGWAGLAGVGSPTNPSRNSWINDYATSWNITSHEIGHNLGARHASTASCTDEGVRVALSSVCTTSEYGDPFDVMASAGSSFNTFLRYEAGLLSTGDILTVSASGSYTVGVAGRSAATNRIVRVARNDGTYLALEFRQPESLFDSWTSSAAVVTGVSIRIAPANPTANTKLVDTTPATTTYIDAPLTVGRTLLDPLSGVTISTTAVGASGAVVQITLPAPIPTATPTPIPTATPTPVPTATPTPVPTATPTPVPTATPPPAPSSTPTPNPTTTPTATPVPTTTPSATPTSTPVPTATPTPEPTATPTPAPTATPPVQVIQPTPIATPAPTPTPDAIKPTVVARAPATNAAFVALAYRPAVRFSESVLNVSTSSIVLRRADTGAVVAGSVVYASSTYRAEFRPKVALLPGVKYTITATSGIVDAANNRLTPISWSFTTDPIVINEKFAKARSVYFASGYHTGYKFNTAGTAVASKKVNLPRASSANTVRRVTVRGKSYLYITNGSWAGYYIPETTRSYVKGLVALKPLPGQRLTFNAGSYTGYRFNNSTGSVSARKAYRLARSSGAPTTQQALINGRLYYYVSAGVWNGYWIPKQTNVRLS